MRGLLGAVLSLALAADPAAAGWRLAAPTRSTRGGLRGGHPVKSHEAFPLALSAASSSRFQSIIRSVSVPAPDGRGDGRGAAIARPIAAAVNPEAVDRLVRAKTVEQAGAAVDFAFEFRRGFPIQLPTRALISASARDEGSTPWLGPARQKLSEPRAPQPPANAQPAVTPARRLRLSIAPLLASVAGIAMLETGSLKGPLRLLLAPTRDLNPFELAPWASALGLLVVGALARCMRGAVGSAISGRRRLYRLAGWAAALWLGAALESGQTGVEALLFPTLLPFAAMIGYSPLVMAPMTSAAALFLAGWYGSGALRRWFDRARPLGPRIFGPKTPKRA